MKNKLLELLRIEALEIKTSFEKASIEGEGTPQEVADRRERVVVKALLEKYFPFPYRTVKGNIIDSYGHRSNSIDCIVLNPAHPFTIDPKNDSASIIFADGVDYAIEVKPNLGDKTEIERALNQVRSVKKLKRKKSSIALGQHSSEEIENGKNIPTFIFADKTYVEIKTLISHIVDYYVENNVSGSEQFDFIVINNRGIVINLRENSYFSLGDYHGFAFAEFKEDTLAAFLLYMNSIPQSRLQISENIIKDYLQEVPQEAELILFDELSNKLNMIR